jgi:outer membrane protein, multidrug efflux system
LRAAWRLAATALVLAGCAVHQVTPDPSPPVTLPEAWRAEALGQAAAAEWWRAFADPELDALVGRALAGNLDLRAAWARLEQAQALWRASGAGWWPQVRADVGASRARSVVDLGAMGTKTMSNNQYAMSLAASYEVDLFGKVRSGRDAAARDLRATRGDAEALAMSLVAQVAEAWFALVELTSQRALLQEQVGRDETQLELVDLRFRNGLATALDVYQQRQKLAGTRARLPEIEGGIQIARQRLALLAGSADVEAIPVPRGELPPPPALPAAGVPMDLLEQRPDVRAARARVEAADHRIAVAVAERLPSLALDASTGFRAASLAALFESWVYSILGGLTAPLVDGGVRAAQVERARAALKERVAAYGKAVLTALFEVEEALVRAHHQERYMARLAVQLETARVTMREARARYLSGLSEYLPVLEALSALHALERAELSARRQLLSYRIQLARALGGGWTRDLEAVEEGG